MARLPYPDPKGFDEKTKELMGRLNRPLNIFRMMAHSPAMLRGVTRFGAEILSHQRLSPKLREIAILRTAKQSEAVYEWSQHVPIALACGVSQSQIDALDKAGPGGEVGEKMFDPCERAVLAAVDELLLGARLSDESLAGLRRFFDECETIELLMAVGFYMLIARFLATTEVEIEEGGIPGSEAVNPRFTQSRRPPPNRES